MTLSSKSPPGFGVRAFLAALRHRYSRDRISEVAGSLTFFALLALFPFLLFLVALGGAFIDSAQAKGLIDQLPPGTPVAVTSFLAGRIRGLHQVRTPGLLTLGAVGTVWAASGGVASLIAALNAVYGVEERRPFWRVRLLAVTLTLSAAALTLLAALLTITAPLLAGRVWGPLGQAVNWLRLPASGVLMMFVWGCLYYFLPDREQEFRVLAPGTVFGVALWLAASYGFSLYVRFFGRYEVTYGTLGGVVVLLLWMWITSQAILLGAQINFLWETHRQRHPKSASARAGRGPSSAAWAAREGRGLLLREERWGLGVPPPP